MKKRFLSLVLFLSVFASLSARTYYRYHRPYRYRSNRGAYVASDIFGGLMSAAITSAAISSGEKRVDNAILELQRQMNSNVNRLRDNLEVALKRLEEALNKELDEQDERMSRLEDKIEELEKKIE